MGAERGRSSSLRAIALELYATALAAADPAAAVHRALEAEDWKSAAGRWALLAAGKAARGMALGAASALAGTPMAGVVVEPSNGNGTREERDRASPREWPIEWRRAGHPLPDRRSLLAARAFERCARRVAGGRAPESFLVLLSGGASALLAAPVPGLRLQDKAAVTRLLLRAGASIDELNAVRKHLSRLKGGGLARLLAPRPVLALVVSDVVSDDLSVVASGPLHPDPTTFADAAAVLEQYGVLEETPTAVRRHLERGRRGLAPETPKPGDLVFREVRHRIVASNATVTAAVAEAAASRGFEVVREERPVVGEARIAAELLRSRLAERVHDPAPGALVSGGETVVTVRGDGTGGRNQELALAFALAVERAGAALPAWALLSVGTDGRDGPTDAAGALVDQDTLERCRAAGIDPRAALERNDSHRVLDAAGDLVRTGATGTNVADLQVLLWERAAPRSRS